MARICVGYETQNEQTEYAGFNTGSANSACKQDCTLLTQGYLMAPVLDRTATCACNTAHAFEEKVRFRTVANWEEEAVSRVEGRGRNAGEKSESVQQKAGKNCQRAAKKYLEQLVNTNIFLSSTEIDSRIMHSCVCAGPEMIHKRRFVPFCRE